MSWLIALGGLAVAALALWLNYKERAAALRGSLYAKQFEVYGVVLCALGELHGIAMTVTTPPGFRLDGPGRLRLHQAARPQVAHLAQVFTETLVFLPQAVADAIVDYYQTLNGISAPPDEKPAPEGFQPPPELSRSRTPPRPAGARGLIRAIVGRDAEADRHRPVQRADAEAPRRSAAGLGGDARSLAIAALAQAARTGLGLG